MRLAQLTLSTLAMALWVTTMGSQCDGALTKLGHGCVPRCIVGVGLEMLRLLMFVIGVLVFEVQAVRMSNKSRGMPRSFFMF